MYVQSRAAGGESKDEPNVGRDYFIVGYAAKPSGVRVRP